MFLLIAVALAFKEKTIELFNKVKDLVDQAKKSKAAIVYTLYLFADMAFTTSVLNTGQYESSYEWRQRKASKKVAYQ